MFSCTRIYILPSSLLYIKKKEEEVKALFWLVLFFQKQWEDGQVLPPSSFHCLPF